MILDPSLLSTLVLLSTAVAAGFTAALWLSLIMWTYRDMRSRTRDPLLRILAALVVAVLFLPGIIIYLILRPPRTIDEEYQQSLEEEALLQAIEDNPLCPGCGRRVRHDWVACPNCHTRIKKLCHQCNQLMELPWNLCPYCGTPTPGVRREDASLEEVLHSLPGELRE